MTLGEAKDLVREHFGRLGFNSTMLVEALKQGRRLVEQQGNFWWMRAEKDFTLTVDQGEYSIIASASNGLNLPDFKQPIALSYRDVDGTDWSPVSLGERDKSVLDLLYQTDDEGAPQDAVVFVNTLHLYPPDPDAEYPMRLYYFQWTDGPTSNTETDDLLTQFPEALIYAAHVVGYEQILKDFQGAGYWRQRFEEQLVLLKRENIERLQVSQLTFEPRSGPGHARNWSNTNYPSGYQR